MSNLVVTMKNGIRIAVPADLSSITTYVLLEQERWFEREIDFIRTALTPGTTAIDIGANLGIYTLSMAQALGPGGRVYAFEPAASVRTSLEYSRDLNGLTNVTVIGAALADEEKEGWLDHGHSSELNAIGEATGASDRQGERIRISTLDLQEVEQGWAPPDFIKIDAEGAEALILAGAPRFFSVHSPLVMYEVKAGMSHNTGLQQMFVDRGYATFRQLGTAPLLVPSPAEAALDGFELNLFACKPDRAAKLAAAGLLVQAPVPYTATAADRTAALRLFAAQPFAAPLAGMEGMADQIEPAYLDVLAAYAAWRDTTRPAAQRYGALLAALEGLRPLVADPATAPATRLCSFARIAAEAGERVQAIGALNQVLQTLSEGAALSIAEPFWPASERFDSIDPGPQFSAWFVAQVAETMERSCAYSSLFGRAPVELSWLATLPFVSLEMERRYLLRQMQDGHRPELPARLAVASPDHLNAELWQGLLPAKAAVG